MLPVLCEHQEAVVQIFLALGNVLSAAAPIRFAMAHRTLFTNLFVHVCELHGFHHDVATLFLDRRACSASIPLASGPIRCA